MKYTLYLETSAIVPGSKPVTTQHFLQVAWHKEDLMKTRTTIRRWANEMGIDVIDSKTAILVIAEGETRLLSTKYADNRLVWKPITPNKVA